MKSGGACRTLLPRTVSIFGEDGGIGLFGGRQRRLRIRRERDRHDVVVAILVGVGRDGLEFVTLLFQARRFEGAADECAFARDAGKFGKRRDLGVLGAASPVGIAIGEEIRNRLLLRIVSGERENDRLG